MSAGTLEGERGQWSVPAGRGCCVADDDRRRIHRLSLALLNIFVFCYVLFKKHYSLSFISYLCAETILTDAELKFLSRLCI